MVSRVELYLKEISVEYKLVDKFPNILISLTEAVNNAIIHGNHYNEDKMVQIKVQSLKKGLLFVVQDEGTGFDNSSICDPTCQENLEKIGGRGVFIMDKLCDELSFHKNGSIVKMYFKL